MIDQKQDKNLRARLKTLATLHVFIILQTTDDGDLDQGNAARCLARNEFD